MKEWRYGLSPVNAIMGLFLDHYLDLVRRYPKHAIVYLTVSSI
jgi:hypothetical protein